MAEMKTKRTDASVDDFFDSIIDEKVRDDSRKIAALMEKATGAKPKMYGANIIGFGEKHLKNEPGLEPDWMEIGFSPRKANLTLYLTYGEDWDEDLLSKLGKHKVGKGCLYFKRLSDVDETILEKVIEKSVEKRREE